MPTPMSDHGDTAREPFLPLSNTSKPSSSSSSSNPRDHNQRQPSRQDVPKRSSARVALGIVLCSGVLLSIVALFGSSISNDQSHDNQGRTCHSIRESVFHNTNNNYNGLNATDLKACIATATRGVSAGVSSKSNLKLLFGGRRGEDYPWDNSMLSWQRTAFHFQPENNWMNDPNGPLYYKGWYHFFYQYNPNAAVWGDIAWGHAVSRDLVHWLHLPLALVPDQWFDINGVWTGSATLLPDGKLVMLYTGWTNGSQQVQNLAYPADPNDPLLLQWNKYPSNPVLYAPPGINDMDFRDPTTGWLTSEGTWRIIIGSMVGTKGIALVYETDDFMNFKQIDHPLHSVAGTGMWECVDFFPVSTTSTRGLDTSVNGPGVKHVVKASLDDHKFDYYAIGTYHEKNCSWVPDNPTIDVGIGIRYDYGNFYASKTFYDESRQRRVLWGWIMESDDEIADVKKGWASLQSIPRTVSLDLKTGSNLLVWPVEEVERLRLRKQEFNNVQIKPGSVVPLELEGATQLDIVAEFELDKTALESMVEWDAEFSCSASQGASQRGALGPFGFLVLAEDCLFEQTPVYFYVAKGRNGTIKTFFCTDSLRSSLANDVVKEVTGSFVPVLAGEKLSVRILVDHSVIESFALGGRTSITSRVYPTRAIYGDARLYLFNNGTEASVVSSVKVWQMDSAFIRPYSSNQ